MREIRTSGSEGGASQTNGTSLPLFFTSNRRRHCFSEDSEAVALRAATQIAHGHLAQLDRASVYGTEGFWNSKYRLGCADAIMPAFLLKPKRCRATALQGLRHIRYLH